MNNTTTENAPVKVGDRLAFCSGFGAGRWDTYEVTKITPTGVIRCGPYSLDPNLRVKGARGYEAPAEGQHITPAIVDAINRQRALAFLQRVKWSDLPTAALVTVCETVNAAKAA